MKRAISLVLMLIFMICGCGMIQLQSESQELVAKISARRVGYGIAKDYPDMARRLTPIAKAVLIGNDQIVIGFSERLRAIALENIDDPLLKADIGDLLALIKIDAPAIRPAQVVMVRAVSKGLIEGIKMGGGK